jgi:hypothetical protein
MLGLPKPGSMTGTSLILDTELATQPIRIVDN